MSLTTKLSKSSLPHSSALNDCRMSRILLRHRKVKSKDRLFNTQCILFQMLSGHFNLLLGIIYESGQISGQSSKLKCSSTIRVLRAHNLDIFIPLYVKVHSMISKKAFEYHIPNHFVKAARTSQFNLPKFSLQSAKCQQGEKAEELQ